MNITHTISLLEIIWMLPLLIGILYTSSNIQKSVKALHTLKASEDFIPGGPRHVVVKGHIRSHIKDTTILLGFIIFGVVAMILPPTTRHFGISSLVFTVVLFYMSLATIYNGIAFARDLARNIAFYEAHPDKVKNGG
jgi:uncharacterized membrane protein